MKPLPVLTLLVHLAADHLAPADVAADAEALFVRVDHFLVTVDVDADLRGFGGRSRCCRGGRIGGGSASGVLFGFGAGLVFAFADADGGAAVGGGLGDWAGGFAFGAAGGSGLRCGGVVVRFGCWFGRGRG